jgi:hypothetical protein
MANFFDDAGTTAGDSIPTSILADALEPVARNLCQHIGLDGGSIACPKTDDGLPELKHWQVIAQRMLLALLQELPADVRVDVFCRGMEALARTVTPAAVTTH